jgi:hypothetical protein
MANPQKHKRNLIDEWPEGEEGAIPAQSGGAHRAGAGAKAPKSVPRRPKIVAYNRNELKPEAALAREPAPPLKLARKHSQPSSPEHLRKLQRLPQLRAHYPARSGSRSGLRG